MAGSGVFTASRTTGVALILGSVVMLGGATVYAFVKDVNGPLIFGQPPREWLRLIDAHTATWRWATILFIVGTLVTLCGWELLARQFQQAGDPGFTGVGLLALAIGATLWLIALAFRLSAELWAAQAAAATRAVPDSYAPLAAWSSALFVLYTILTFGGLALYGAAMLVSPLSPLLPQWLGWVSIVYGLAGLVLLGVSRDAPPFLHYLPTLLIGVILVLP
jgi:hypothetical protein